MPDTQPPHRLAYWSRPEYRAAVASLPCWAEGCEGLTTDRWCPACAATSAQRAARAASWLEGEE